MTTDVDQRVRLAVYERFAALARTPEPAEVAEAAGVAEADVQPAYERLDAAHLVVLGGDRKLWMAHPFSAVPTAYRALSGGRSWYANCIWDALGIVALLRADGDVETTCEDCGEPLRLRVRNGALEPTEHVVHFAVPAAHWYDDIGFT
jgi:hypothetical protein